MAEASPTGFRVLVSFNGCRAPRLFSKRCAGRARPRLPPGSPSTTVRRLVKVGGRTAPGSGEDVGGMLVDGRANHELRFRDAGAYGTAAATDKGRLVQRHLTMTKTAASPAPAEQATDLTRDMGNTLLVSFMSVMVVAELVGLWVTRMRFPSNPSAWAAWAGRHG